ncbi:26S proteasome non-ATPase regulatory subunit 4 homolog isoform X2 [Rutidosis leptorrhynchoides]|uniref:26S proteasome non-ATPase regulatory subunit 4 homolog isoform X2 n=1 Tax=Rutidosis leptorrhynchoides TaxID=125765 RepID=UPI003A99B24E
MASLLAARLAQNSLRLSISSRSASLIHRRGLASVSDLHGRKKVENPNSPSRLKEEHEVIYICIDTSKWMLRLPRCYQLQVNSVRSYCRAKLTSNPRNEIGIFVMGNTIKVRRRIDPTSDLDILMRRLLCPSAAGGDELNFRDGITSCWDKLDHYPSNPKRIVFFTGGPIDFELEEAEWYGGRLKQDGIAVDVVNFFLDEQFALWKLALETFVASANDNNNSLIKHIPADSLTPVRNVLSSLVEREIGNNEEYKLKNEAIALEAYLKYGKWTVALPGYFEKKIMNEKNKNLS